MRKRLVGSLMAIVMLVFSVNVYAAEVDSQMKEENVSSEEPEETELVQEEDGKVSQSDSEEPESNEQGDIPVEIDEAGEGEEGNVSSEEPEETEPLQEEDGDVLQSDSVEPESDAQGDISIEIDEEGEEELLRAGNGIPINEVNFPDENFREYILGYGGIDSNKDQILSEEEAGRVTRLEIDFWGIEDLKGIEYFTGLEYLKVNNNLLTSLDVSKNTALKQLDCDLNDLTSLDVSKNIALELLGCTYCELSNLYTGRNTALETLLCWGNHLSSLDVSGNTSLKVLDCSANELTSLDVSKNTALEELSINNNNLRSLDLSKNIALTTLDWGFNELSSLDLSKNTALTDLFGNGNSFFDQNGKINMSQRDGNFISGKVSNLQNLSLEGNIFTRLDPSKDGTYDYDCGRNITMTVTIKGEEWPFSDVEVRPGYWKYDSIKYVYDNNIMNGINGTTRFDPDEPLTRAMFATVLYRMAGNPAVQFQNKFEDVTAGRYYSNAVIWAYEQGIVQGMEGGKRYGIDEYITREQIAKMLKEYGRVAGYNLDDSVDIGGFPDYREVSGWAVNYMKWAVGSGMVTGKNINGVYYLDPRGNATRAECAAMLTRFMKRYQ